MSCFVTDDQAAVVVLDCPGEDLRGRSGHAAGHHHQGPLPGDAGVGVAVRRDGAVEFLDSDDRAFVDEQSRDLDRVLEGSTAVGSEVEDHGVDLAVLVEGVERLADVSRGTAEIGDTAAFGVKVAIERRHVDHADPSAGSLDPLTGIDDHRSDRRLLQLDHLSSQLVDLCFACLGRLDPQPDLGVFLSADQPNDTAELHFHDVHDVTLFLADTDNLVAQFQSVVFVGSTTWHDLADNGESVFTAQRGSDPLEAKSHADVEVLTGLR